MASPSLQKTANPKKDYSFLLRFEDYWAIWLGAIILIFCMFVFFGNPPADMNQIIADSNAAMQAEAERAPFKTIAWYEANAAKSKLSGSNTPMSKAISKYFNTPGGWSTSSPMKSFYLSKADAEAKSAAS
ncbi:MAG: putative sulfate exporter family transporter, partial [Dehalobacterium sp.]